MTERAVEQLLKKWADARELGQSVSVEELCRDRPELMEAVRERLAGFPISFSDAETITLGDPARCPDEKAPQPSTKLGKYEVVQVLGEGGQGSAILAVDPDLKRRVVLKQYHVRGAESSRERELLSEGRTLARIDSPFVARCLGVERANQRVYLVVEFVPGTSLQCRQKNAPLLFKEAAQVVEQVARGVAAIHSAGFLHRDIKPANIILGEDGVPKLVDFGLAAPIASDSLHGVAGTFAFMAPEQARGEGERIDPRTDVFALGGVLYFLLTGRPPYRTSSKKLSLEQAKEASFSRPRSVNSKIPRRLERICLKAMGASPSNRYASAGELASALRSYQRSPLVAATIAVALVAVCLVSFLLWAPWQVQELDGELTATLWSAEKRGLAVNQPGALPARSGDAVHLKAQLNQPAYVYLVWIDGQGKPSALYPWNPSDGFRGLAKKSREEVVHSPPEYDRGWELGGAAGLETALLLARRTPLPADASLPALLENLPPAPLRDPLEYAMIDPDAPAVGRHRGIDTSQTKAIDDPLLWLMERLRPHFELIRAVRFAYAGE
jgi:hypothetical protein